MARRGPQCDAGHRIRDATKPRRKESRPPVGQIASPGALCRSPDARASRFTSRLPEKPICRHQIDSIWSESALAVGDLARAQKLGTVGVGDEDLSPRGALTDFPNRLAQNLQARAQRRV